VFTSDNQEALVAFALKRKKAVPSCLGSISRLLARYVRFLGALLDENLSFKWHVQVIRFKISHGLEIIQKLNRLFPFPVIPLFMFLSHLSLYLLRFVCADVCLSFCIASVHDLHEKAAIVLRLTTHTPVDLLKMKKMYDMSLSSLSFVLKVGFCGGFIFKIVSFL